MVPYLPAEILSSIAEHVVRENDSHKLTPYILVNKSWQAFFERRIYASVIVLSPSYETIVKTSHNEQHKKRGLDLRKLAEITSGPQHWQQLRRTYIQRIIYRAAVPYWISPHRAWSSQTGVSKSSWRRDNNEACFIGLQSLFDHISKWTNQSISLGIALRAELADTTFKAKSHEPGTRDIRQTEDSYVPPYTAEFRPDWYLPKAQCVTSLDFPTYYTNYNFSMEPENGVSLPAVIHIASACSALQKISLDGQQTISYSSPGLRRKIWDGNAAALTRLPPTVQHVKFIGTQPFQSYNFRGADHFQAENRLNTLCTALRGISTRLTSLHITEEAIFSELFCLNAIPGQMGDMYWPHLEVLHLGTTRMSLAFKHMDRYADCSGKNGTPYTHYIDDLFESVGHAAQRMPRLKDAIVDLSCYHIEPYPENSTLCFRDRKWMVSSVPRMGCTYEPSLRVLEAWKIGGDLQSRTGQDEEGRDAMYWEATYTSWPPAESR
jgi:hypothetical protein